MKSLCLFLSLIVCCPLAIITGWAFSQETPGVYTLENAIEEALAKNWAYKARQEKIVQAGHLKNQARADFLPKLSMHYGYTRDNEARTFRSSLTPSEKIAISSQDNYQWIGTVRQPVFAGFALISSFRLAELGIDLSELEIELDKLDLALKVKEIYFDILKADKGVEVAGMSVETLQSNVEMARSFYEVKMIPISDLLKAEVELAGAEEFLVKAQKACQSARSSFNSLLSRPVNVPVDVEDILVYEPEQGDYQHYLEMALKSRPEMKLLDIQILQTDQEIRLAKSKHYPEIAFTYDYIKEGDTPGVTGSPYHDANRWEAKVMLSFTLWEWGKTYYAAREKESLKNELMLTIHALEDSIRLELKEAMLSLAEADSWAG